MTDQAVWFDRDVRIGADSVLLLPDVVAELEAKRVLLVTGNTSFEASGASRALGPLSSVATVERWTDFSPNPGAEELIRGLEVVERFHPDLIVGIGGGSPMDMAKLLIAYRGVASQVALNDGIRSGRTAGSESSTDLVLAPTTSGSGSEATHFAVVYIDDEKFSVADQSLLPRTVLLDHRLTLSSSSYQRATSGIDALAQAMESMWAVAATDESRRFAEQALELTLQHIRDFVNEGTESSARGMAFASHLAGRAIDMTKTTASHAMAYGLTKQHGISHGHAVALTLGTLLELHAEETAPLRETVDPYLHRNSLRQILRLLGAETPRDGREQIRSLMCDLGLDPDLVSAAGGPVDTSQLALGVNPDRLGNNPMAFDHAALAKIYESAISPAV